MRLERFQLSGKDARALRLARVLRRARMLGSLARDILAWRKGVRAFSPAAWSFALSFFWLATQFAQLGFFTLPSLVLFGGLCLAALIDARYLILPDGPLAALAVTGVAMRLVLPIEATLPYFAAAAFGFAMLRATAWAFEKLRGFPGLGQGDARLFAVAGLWLGWDGLPSCLLVATLSAALAAAIALRDGTLKNVRDPLPFGPHLALGLWLVWAMGPLNAASSSA